MVSSQLYKFPLLKNQQQKATKERKKQKKQTKCFFFCLSLLEYVHYSLQYIKPYYNYLLFQNKYNLETFPLMECQGGMFKFRNAKFK